MCLSALFAYINLSISYAPPWRLQSADLKAHPAAYSPGATTPSACAAGFCGTAQLPVAAPALFHKAPACHKPTDLRGGLCGLRAAGLGFVYWGVFVRIGPSSAPGGRPALALAASSITADTVAVGSWQLQLQLRVALPLFNCHAGTGRLVGVRLAGAPFCRKRGPGMWTEDRPIHSTRWMDAECSRSVRLRLRAAWQCV